MAGRRRDAEEAQEREEPSALAEGSSSWVEVLGAYDAVGRKPFAWSHALATSLMSFLSTLTCL